MTYNDIKLATLQKMFHDVTSTEPTILTKPYLDKMPYLLNYAIQRITAAGFGERKYVEIISSVPKNMLGNSAQYYKAMHIKEEERFRAPYGKSYFFQVFGKGTVRIFVGGELIKTIENKDENEFKKYKGHLENDENKAVELVFSGSSSFLRKNIAVYNDVFNSDDVVYEISEMKFYNMDELTQDFYKFDSESVVVCEGENKAYGFMGEKTFCINGLVSGVFKVPYIAYPQVVTNTTSEDAPLKIPGQLCGIIPYYMASELYLEEDSGLCVGWRNKFEAELREFVINGSRRPANRYRVVNLGGDTLGNI